MERKGNHWQKNVGGSLVINFSTEKKEVDGTSDDKKKYV